VSAVPARGNNPGGTNGDRDPRSVDIPARVMSESTMSAPDQPAAASPDGVSSPPRAVGPRGRYLLGALLGRGGMADVYQAHDQVLGRDVAVKLLRDRTPDPMERHRFVAEAKTLARLNQANLVTILDAGISEDHPFLVLEIVIGSSLAVALKQAGGAFAPPRVATIGAQVAAALAHCHAAGVVHRDVKPGNILLGAGDRTLLTDFGISRLLDGSTQHTQTGSTIGTASYLAPEQVRGDELTPAVDMYALGLVLLEACTGRREYSGTPVEAAVARLHRSPRIPADLPPSLCSILSSLTQTDPTARPTAAETAHALRAAAETPMELGGTFASAGEAVAVEPFDAPTAAHALTVAGRRRRFSLVALSGWTAAAVAAAALALTLHGLSPTAAKPPTATTSPGSVAAPRTTSQAKVTPAAKIEPTRSTTRHASGTPKTGSPNRRGPSPAKHKSSPHAQAKAKKVKKVKGHRKRK
jgi:tRNA A-37 threonylcarbamoyl transferase component Bud32